MLKLTKTRFYLEIKTTHRAYSSIIVVLTLQETIIPQKIIKHTIDYNDTASL